MVGGRAGEEGEYMYARAGNLTASVSVCLCERLSMRRYVCFHLFLLFFIPFHWAGRVWKAGAGRGRGVDGWNGKAAAWDDFDIEKRGKRFC